MFAQGMFDEGMFAQGMFDEQLERLMKVLKRGHIWAINIGENFQVCRDFKGFNIILGPTIGSKCLGRSETMLVSHYALSRSPGRWCRLEGARAEASCSPCKF